MWPLKLIILEKQAEGFNTHFNVSTDIGGKTFIFQLNLGRWPLKWFILEKQSLFWGIQHTFIMFPRT